MLLNNFFGMAICSEFELCSQAEYCCTAMQPLKLSNLFCSSLCCLILFHGRDLTYVSASFSSMSLHHGGGSL